jgi:hypothetical protein
MGELCSSVINELVFIVPNSAHRPTLELPNNPFTNMCHGHRQSAYVHKPVISLKDAGGKLQRDSLATL